MSLIASNEETSAPVEQAGSVQAVIAAAVHGLASAIAAAGNIKSNVIKTLGWQKGGVGLTSSQAGVLSVQRYLDQAGTIPVGAAITANLTAATAAAVTWSDGLPCQSIQIEVTNSSGSTAAVLTGTTVLLQAQ